MNWQSNISPVVWSSITLTTDYYTWKGKTDRAKDYQRRASREMDDYRTRMRYAANADDKAADYLRRALNLLRK